MRSPLQWYGGKGHLIKYLQQYRPIQYATYFEPYFGGGSLFFALPSAQQEIINDLDAGVANFYRVLSASKTFDRFQALVRFTPYARSLHSECKTTWSSDGDPVICAWRWWILVRQSFAGKFATSWSFNVLPRGFQVRKYNSAVKRLPKAHARLQNTTIHNRPALSFPWSEFSPSTWVYADPPYAHDTRISTAAYKHEMTNVQHRLLVDTLLCTKAMVLISGYIHPIYRPLEDAGWRRVDIPIACYSAGTTAYDKRTGERKSTAHRSMRVESLWLNYDPATSKLIVK